MPIGDIAALPAAVLALLQLADWLHGAIALPFALVSRFSYGCTMTKMRSLWLGELPLGEAFWTWAIGIGLLINLTTSVLFLALITIDRPWAALFVGYGLSVPYNVVAVVGVWRSAARYEGPPGHAELARIVVVGVMLLLSVT
jgi:hypothetical protein